MAIDDLKTPSDDEDFVELVKEHHRAAMSHLKEWRKEAVENYQYVAGHQYTDEEMGALEEKEMASVVFNRIDPMISAVIGHQINNRTEIEYIPRETGDIEKNEVLTGAVRWADDECDAEDEVSYAFWDMVVSGIGWTETVMNYDEDAEGKLHTAVRIAPLEMLYDPKSTKPNLSDASYLIRERWWPRKDAVAQWPKLRDLSVSDAESWASEGSDNHDASRAWMYETDAGRFYRKNDDQVLIIQYQWYEFAPVYMVGDPTTGRVIELDQSRFNRVKARLDETGGRYIKQMRKRYYQAFICGPYVLERGESPYPNGFTFKAMTGKRDEIENTWYGLVRGMKDPQRWSNKFFMEIHEIMISNRRGGAFVEIDALVDQRAAETAWNDPTGLIFLNPGALGKGKIQERNPAQYPAGLDRLMQIAVSSIPDVSGLNLELLGMVDRDQPGVVERQRKQAALTIIAGLFNSLRRHTKERGRLVLYFILEYMSDGRLIRITGQNGMEQYVPLIREEGTAKYDVIVSEAPTSPNQKEETFLVLSQILPLLQQYNVPLPPETLEYLPLPSRLTKAWAQAMQPDPRQQKLQQQMEDLEVRLQASEVAKNESAAMLNEVKAATEKLTAKVEQYRSLNELVGSVAPTPAQKPTKK